MDVMDKTYICDKMVLVDDREPKNVIEKGFEFFSDLTVARLDVGDVVNGNIAIERKKANDFASSINNKRMINQIVNLKANFEIPILIITGSYNDVATNRHQDMSAARYRSEIDQIKLLYRIPVFEIPKSENEEKFWKKCDWIFRKSKITPSSTVQRVAKYNGDERVAVLCGITGLGEKRAKAILKQFPKIKNICSASIEDLTTVKGIGKNRARRIKKVF